MTLSNGYVCPGDGVGRARRNQGSAAGRTLFPHAPCVAVSSPPSPLSGEGTGEALPLSEGNVRGIRTLRSPDMPAPAQGDIT